MTTVRYDSNKADEDARAQERLTDDQVNAVFSSRMQKALRYLRSEGIVVEIVDNVRKILNGGV
jgi:hypothetical protein